MHLKILCEKVNEASAKTIGVTAVELVSGETAK